MHAICQHFVWLDVARWMPDVLLGMLDVLQAISVMAYRRSMQYKSDWNETPHTLCIEKNNKKTLMQIIGICWSFVRSWSWNWQAPKPQGASDFFCSARLYICGLRKHKTWNTNRACNPSWTTILTFPFGAHLSILLYFIATQQKVKSCQW